MKLRDDQLRLQGLLKETITLLCKNGLHFKSGFCVEALIGITTDDSDVFLVNIKESVRNDDGGEQSELDISVHKQTAEGDSESEEHKSRPSRKRPPDGGTHSTPIKRSRSDDDAQSDDENDDGSSTTEHDLANVKREPDEDLVFVKQELTSDFDTQNTSQFSLPPGQSQGYSATQDPSFDSSHDGSTSGMAWNPAGNMDPNSMAMAAQSQSGSQQVKPVIRAGIICQICHVSCTTTAQLNAHYNTTHPTPQPAPKVKNYSCDVCGKKYTSKQNLKAHLYSAHGMGTQNSKCKKCGKNFTWTQQLREHVLKEHS